MLNQEMDQVVLVKGWKKSANWSFPRGKINKDEPDLECAVREVYEETGFHLRDAGMVGNDEDMKYIEVTMREQHMRLYVFRGVPMDAHFEPRTRKEISKIQWYKLSELPTLKKQKQQQEGRGEDLAVNANKFYMVAPFMVPLKKWIAQRKKLERRNARSQLSTTSIKTNGNVETPEKQISYSTSHESPPTPDDLDGIVAKLRQSDQAKPSGDLFEASKPSMSAQDASAHLKSLLRVPPNTIENNSSSGPNVSETLNSGALLALLQPAGPTKQDHSPQTPLVKAPGTTVSPLVPNNEHASLDSSFRHPSPVLHLISNQQNNSQSMPHSTFHSTNSSNYPPVQTHQRSQVVRQLQPSIHKDPQQTHFGPQMQPPHLRTGDSDFAQNSQVPGIHTMSVPPANKLPRPKLTTHSSALLNLFKNTQPPEVKAASSFSGTESSAMQSKENVRTAEVLSNGKNPHTSAGDQTLPLALSPIVPLQEFGGECELIMSSPHTRGKRSTQQYQDRVVMPRDQFPTDRTKTEAVDERFESQRSTPTLASNISAKPRSEHQDTLLDLFRKTPVSEVAEPGTLPTHSSPALSTQTLEPPSTVVELSAMPSPAHSRQALHVKTKLPAPGSGGVVNGPSRIPTTPVTTLRPKSPPLSATVNGPLDVPQFEMLEGNSRSRAGDGKPPNKHPVPPRRSPVSIIPRPAGDRNPKSFVKPGAFVISDQPREKPSLITTDLRSPSSNTAMTDTNSKLKQPQILRRPGPVLRASEDLAVPSPIQPLPSPKLDSHLKSGKNHSKEHKNLLLALFSKPSPLTTPTTLNSADVISPLSETKVLRRTQSPAMPSTAPRSRMGSLTSAIGEGSQKMGSGIQTPRTTPANRTFLLGYLEEVAKGERR